MKQKAGGARLAVFVLPPTPDAIAAVLVIRANSKLGCWSLWGGGEIRKSLLLLPSSLSPSVSRMEWEEETDEEA